MVHCIEVIEYFKNDSLFAWVIIQMYDYMSIFFIVLIKLNDNKLSSPLYQRKKLFRF